jgi:hypothetical protein
MRVRLSRRSPGSVVEWHTRHTQNVLRKRLGSSPSGPTNLVLYGRVVKLADTVASEAAAKASRFKSERAHQSFPDGLVAKLGMRLALNPDMREFDSHRDQKSRLRSRS